jgi:Formylmethanofuran dehydrogenase subunit E
MGTRMTMAGMRELDMSPMEKNRNLIVYVEIDRCATDAIQAITGCSLGHRTLKLRDYGKFAATFVDTRTGKAVRVSVRQKPSPERDGGDAKEAMKEAIKTLSMVPEAELLLIQQVSVNIPEEDIPGFPKHKATCSLCGEQTLDSREVIVDGKTCCKPCAAGAYYTTHEAPGKKG